MFFDFYQNHSADECVYAVKAKCILAHERKELALPRFELGTVVGSHLGSETQVGRGNPFGPAQF